MKRYNKFYNVSLGNFLKVACCSLSIITIASCAEEPLEGEESNSKSDLLKAANDLSSALEKSGRDISIDYLDDIENLDFQKAQILCKNLEEIQGNESITDEIKSLAANLRSECNKFFDFKKEENKPTDDKPSQEEPKLNIAEEWKKIENDVNELINKFQKLGKDEDFLNPLKSILEIGGDLYNNDFNGDLKCLKFPLYEDKEKKALTNNQDVLDLLSKIESEIDAFIDKFDKSEQAVGSSSQEESKLNKTEKWKKVEDAAQKLITKFQSAGKKENFWDHLQSILDTGKRICANDSYSNFTSDLYGVKCFKFNDEDRVEFSSDQNVIELMNKVEAEINDFINKFYKSAPAGDSKVS